MGGRIRTADPCVAAPQALSMNTRLGNPGLNMDSFQQPSPHADFLIVSGTFQDLTMPLSRLAKTVSSFATFCNIIFYAPLATDSGCTYGKAIVRGHGESREHTAAHAECIDGGECKSGRASEATRGYTSSGIRVSRRKPRTGCQQVRRR